MFLKHLIPVGSPNGMLRNCLLLAVFSITAVNLNAAEPWLDSRDTGLRVDIERLSNAGIIKVPINTRPLMWLSILNNLDDTDAKALPAKLKNSYARVLTAGKKATRISRPSQSIRLSVANESQLFRHFGDKAREEAEITLRQKGITEHFTYNLEVTKTSNPWDDEKTHYDNSYFGMVVGNWVGLIGSVERWWGPSWNSSLILSNNARPTTGISLQRNYSEPFKTPFLAWLGPWTTNAFISELDDDRFVKNAKLVGMTVGFRPTDTLEINLRRSAQWGGDGRPQNVGNFFELLTGLADNCVSVDCKEDEPGNQLGGIDFRWDIPSLDASVYAQTIGEDEAGGLPSRRANQAGMQFHLANSWFEGTVFVEHDETSLDTGARKYNTLYNHRIYRTGYRYEGRVIGATWDNDSTVTSLGAVGYLNNGDRLEARYSFGDINVDTLVEDPTSRHSITSKKTALTTFAAKWQRPFIWGEIEVEGRYTDQQIDVFGRQDGSLRLAASVNYNFY
jgi:hypothetical protein